MKIRSKVLRKWKSANRTVPKTLSVFRDLHIKKLYLEEFIRKVRSVYRFFFAWKIICGMLRAYSIIIITYMYAVCFALTVLFRSTTVRAFEFFSGKTVNFRQKKRYATRALRDRVREKYPSGKWYGMVRYGTELRINSDPLLYLIARSGS